jgi:hypothetical protein
VTAREYERTHELRDRRRAQRHRSRNRILVAIGVLLAFGIGVALGQALHDNPRPGDRTSVTTIPPLTTTIRP